MPNYQKGIIYKLCCKNPLITDIYIGSTTNFRERKHSHKSISNCSNSSFSNRKIYKTINENGGFSNWDMVLIRDYPCNSKKELEKEEQRFKDMIKPTLNTYNCYLTPEEKIEYKKQWRINNKKEIAEYKKKYRAENKKAIQLYKKQYRLTKRDHIIEYQKLYYEKNKSIIDEKNKLYYNVIKHIKYVCPYCCFRGMKCKYNIHIKTCKKLKDLKNII